MRRSFPHPIATALAAMPWLALACAAALGLGISIHGAALGPGLGTPTLVLRIFALVLGAVGTVRNLRPESWGPAQVRWLGLPPRDWAFCAGFAVTGTIALSVML